MFPVKSRVDPDLELRPEGNRYRRGGETHTRRRSLRSDRGQRVLERRGGWVGGGGRGWWLETTLTENQETKVHVWKLVRNLSIEMTNDVKTETLVLVTGP